MFKALITLSLFAFLSQLAVASDGGLSPQSTQRISKEEYLKRRAEHTQDKVSISESRKELFELKKSLRAQSCRGNANSSGWRCKYQASERLLAASYYNIKARFLRFIDEVSNKVTLTMTDVSESVRQYNILGGERVRINAKPTAGGIYVETTGGQERPQVRFRTTQEMTDPDGTVVKVIWDFGDGTSMEIPASELNSYAEITHFYSVPAHYYVSLSIIDNDGETQTYKTYAETDYNPAPLPTFNVSVTQGASPLLVNFAGTGEDPTGENVSYYWDFGDGSSATGSSVNHTFTTSGVYTVWHVTRDASGASSAAAVSIYVDEVPPATSTEPTGIIQTNETFGVAPFLVNFDASASFDADGEIVSYRWDFGDFDSAFTFAEGEKASHTYQIPGTYEATLILTDEDGAESYTTVSIHVSGSGVLAPQILTRQRSEDPLEVTFDGNHRSLRSTAERSSHFWNFGDGNTASGQRSQTHTYAAAGTYTVTLHVLDVQGVRHQVSKQITVGSSVDSPHASFTRDIETPKISEILIFDATESSDDNESLPLTYRWDFGDGTQLVSADPYMAYRYELPGTYYVQLAVTNTRGISSRTTRIVSVYAGTPVLADLRYNPKVGVAPLTVDFDASNTKSAGGDIVEYNLTIDGETLISKESTSEHIFEDPGEYYLSFAAKDAIGNSATLEKAVLVVDSGEIPSGNSAPNAQMLFYQDGSNALSYVFDCYDSNDPDEDDFVYSCDWKINGKSLPDAFELSHTFETAGRYIIELTVTDNWGATATQVRQLDLTGSVSPVLAFDESPIRPQPSEVVRFNAEASFIPNEQIVNYSWNFGDSNTGEGINVQHAYLSAGTYTVTLTLTDSQSATYVVTKDIVVAAAANPTIQVTIQDAELTLPSGVSSFSSDKGSVRFSVRGTSQSVGRLVRAEWDFGDGQVGFGLDTEYTYHQPGVYTVQVTGYDSEDRYTQVSRSVTITDGGCIREEGQNSCLVVDSSLQNVVSLTGSSILFKQSASVLDFDGASFPVVRLESLDGSDRVYDVEAVTSSGDSEKVEVSMASILQNKDIDLTAPYRLVVQAELSPSGKEMMESPELYFGSTSLGISVSETPAQIEIVHSSAQIRKFIELTSSSSIQVGNLPAGNITIIAESNGKHMIKNIVALPRTPLNITLNFDEESLSTLGVKSRQKNKADISSFARWKLDEEKLLTTNIGESIVAKGDLGFCGEKSPFMETLPRNSGSGQDQIWHFSSYSPMEQSRYREVPRTMRKPVRLSCGFASDSLMYGYAKWKYKEGPSRCWNSEKADKYWDWYLKRLRRENEPTTIRYQVRDAWSGDSYVNYIVTSPSDLRKKKGLSLNDLTWKVGVPSADGQDWNLRAEYDIIIPPQFKRPEIRFELYSPEPSTSDGLYVVECDVTDSNIEPKITNITATEMGTAGKHQINGLHSLQKRYGFFPVNYDYNSGSPVSSEADLAKVSYEVEIQTQDRSDITWQGVNVEWSYGESSFSKLYLFAGAGVTNSSLGVLRNYFLIDTQEVLEGLSSPIQWKQDSSYVSLVVKPVGKISDDYDYVGKGRTIYFSPLFELRALRDEQSLNLCSNGFFGSNLSTYVDGSMLRTLIDLGGKGYGVRCADFSLPFGGDFNTTVKTLKGNRDGRSGYIKTFNASAAAQDSYDDFSVMSPLRIGDVEAYLDFSEAASIVAAETSETSGGFSTPKKKIYDFCHPSVGSPLPPCTSQTTFEDLNHEMVSTICQFYGAEGDPIDGCPTDSLIPAVRFANWVKYNAAAFEGSRFVGISASLADGRGLLPSPFEASAWQYDALVRGVWPDGLPIYLPSESGDRFIGQRISECHESKMGCVGLNSVFSQEQTVLESVPVRAGWR